MGVCVSQLQAGAKGLEYTHGNEVLLNEMLDQIQQLVKLHPAEAEVGLGADEPAYPLPPFGFRPLFPAPIFSTHASWHAWRR